MKITIDTEDIIQWCADVSTRWEYDHTFADDLSEYDDGKFTMMWAMIEGICKWGNKKNSDKLYDYISNGIDEVVANQTICKGCKYRMLDECPCKSNGGGKFKHYYLEAVAAGTSCDCR